MRAEPLRGSLASTTTLPLCRAHPRRRRWRAVAEGPRSAARSRCSRESASRRIRDSKRSTAPCLQRAISGFLEGDLDGRRVDDLCLAVLYAVEEAAQAVLLGVPRAS